MSRTIGEVVPMRRPLMRCFAGALLVCGVVFGQGMTGRIRVIIQAPDGSVVPGATVTVEAPDALGSRTAASDQRGVAAFARLQPSAAYLVTVTMDRFESVRFENVLVRAGQTSALRAALTVSPIRAEILVVGKSPTIDFTNTITGQDITLELTESLPTGRTYQNYLQLVPGVMPTDPTDLDENPAARSGMNYTDGGGRIGRSRDNFYYIEGIDVTDPYSGTFGANLNTEIIQEQSVMTGGIPAEYVGAPGLVSNVVTKSGGNAFHGSVNYFFQHDGLVAENEHADAADFSTYDTAFTIGGPILRDRIWFFASYRLLNREEEVSSLDTDEYMRTVNTDAEQGFAKLSWNPTSRISVVGTFLTDPSETDGQTSRDVSNNHDRTAEDGGSRYILTYSHVLGAAYVTFSAGRHSGNINRFPANPEIRNRVSFNLEDVETFTTEDTQLGGYGETLLNELANEFVRGKLEYYLGTGWGNHTISIGAEYLRHEDQWDFFYSGGQSYTSLHSRYAGITAYDFVNGEWTVVPWNYQEIPFDFTGTISAIDASPNREMHYSILDLNGDGTISMDEMGQALVFDSTAGNPHGMINLKRLVQTTFDPVATSVKGTTFFVQDSFQRRRLTINAGLRAEEWRHYATTGEKVAEFDYQLSPRLGVIYDLTGRGRQKLSAFYGRYYDPIRMNMTAFAGNLTGPGGEEQIWVNNEWLTYRVRGGIQQPDALFAPTTRTPYTDDYQLAYQMELGHNVSFEVLVTRRETRDIMEDYDLCLYAYCVDGTTQYPGPMDHPDSLWLGPDYFGYAVNPGSNYVIATMEGARRDYNIGELVFRRRFNNRWQMLASYTYTDAEGNSNSDSSAGFPGDVLMFDPRAPNQTGRQPGIIQNIFKVAGSYSWNNGFLVGGSYRWNSGSVANKTWRVFGIHVPILSAEPFEYAGITSPWIAEDAVGSITNDSWGTLDLRGQYRHTFGRIEGEFFLDVFNVLDDQAAVRNQDLIHGDETAAFGEAIQWVGPRRLYLGVRLSF